MRNSNGLICEDRKGLHFTYSTPMQYETLIVKGEWIRLKIAHV